MNVTDPNCNPWVPDVNNLSNDCFIKKVFTTGNNRKRIPCVRWKCEVCILVTSFYA